MAQKVEVEPYVDTDKRVRFPGLLPSEVHDLSKKKRRVTDKPAHSASVQGLVVDALNVTLLSASLDGTIKVCCELSQY